MARRDDLFSLDALEDLDSMMEVVQQIALKDGSEVLALDRETRWRLEEAVERGLMLQTLLETGLRASELVQLRVEDISLTERVVTIR